MSDAARAPVISTFFTRTVAERSDDQALGFIRDGELHWRTWREVADAAAVTAADMRAAGIGAADRVAHVSENRYEWVITDLAMHVAGVVHVPIHVTLSGPQIAEQIRDCGAKLAIVSSDSLLEKFAAALSADVRIFIHDNCHIEQCRPTSAVAPSPAPSPQSPAPDSLATILYTSGTTGRPRGVMLSHGNLASNAAAVCEEHCVDSSHTMLCILPLSHIYARTCDLYTWICSGSRLVLGESRETLLRDCQLAQPTTLNAVPFVYQRVMDGVCSCSSNNPAAALRNAFGGQIQLLYCGGAPAAPNVEAWYAENGLPLLPGYGLTEASPVIAVSTPTARRFGTVGRAIPGIEIRTASDGELLTRGPHVMLGYWQNEAATAEAIRDGWLYTGDLAEIDDDGFVFIRGRKKELIVLSTGKKVVPTRVEALLNASPLIEQSAVFGDGRCGLVALVVPTAAAPTSSQEQGAKSELIAAEIKRCLSSAAHEEQVHRFAILDRPFSIERGELTAKMSLCRTAIARNFAAELTGLEGPPEGPETRLQAAHQTA
jgi:long-chain acyl-CoA synthetase